MDNDFSGQSYQTVGHILVAAIKAGDTGDAGGWDAALVGYWLALRHPVGGAAMAARVADAIAINGCAHITLHGSRDRGLAFALSDRFLDLGGRARAAASCATPATVLAAAPRPRRPGGRA